MFSIGCISGCAWVCFVRTWIMFPFFKKKWKSDIAAMCFSAMFLNGDDGAEFFNSCTSSFNSIVAFYDADLNDITYSWGGC